ncbi:MAG TPA: peptide-methionine (S)-S-oxide reductase MsrA [Puia sp.]
MSITSIATFGTGCFWCTEAVFQQLKGVLKVTSGYMGGHTENPKYKEVCTGATGHAECLQILFDPAIISYEDLLEVFWFSHNPTQLNRQGNDVGTQYRSAIFYHNPEQQRQAEEFKKELAGQKAYEEPVVTEITAATDFYPAEDYHIDYFSTNASQPYCSMIIRPKVEKIKRVFADKIKP